jgi:hypothetical protein
MRTPFRRGPSSYAGGATLVFLAACGGRTSLEESPEETVEAGGPDGGLPSDARSVNEAGSCIEVDLSTYDQSCDVASDCFRVTGGLVCSSEFLCAYCGGSFVNRSEAARYQSAIASLTGGACDCIEAVPQCVQNKCQLCEPASEPSGCSDLDAQMSPDSSPLDGGQCIDIDLSTYDQSCVTSSDCIEITSGLICQGNCSCGGSTINQSGQSRYDQAINSIVTEDCPCSFNGGPKCLQGECVMCNTASGSGPTDCQDAAP